jgi:hypothetical protein
MGIVRRKVAITNLLLRSEELDNAAWTAGGSTAPTFNALAAPDGQTTAELLTSGNAAGNGIYQAFTVTALTTYTLSCFARLGTLIAADFTYAVYDQTNSAFVTTDGVYDNPPNSSGWTRVSVTTTTPAGCTTLRYYPMRKQAGVVGTFYVWGAQANPGSVVHPYIATVGAIVTLQRNGRR